MTKPNNITLRIKRKYFDLILSGKKHIEYRDSKNYYDKLFKNKSNAETLTLHYQQDRRLKCDILKIKRMTIGTAKLLNPELFENTDIQFGTHVYALFIKRPRLI